MPQEPSDKTNESGLIIRQGTDLATVTDGGSSALPEIINRSLAHIQTSKALATRHRIGEHELLGPDYRLVCALAEDLELAPEEMLCRLLDSPDYVDDFRTLLTGVRFRALCMANCKILEISCFPRIPGLTLDKLYLGKGTIRQLDLTCHSGLRWLACGGLALTELDLSQVPNLRVLDCCANELEQLDLSPISRLESLECSGDRLQMLDLSHVPNLKSLYCVVNSIRSLDLSPSGA